MLQASDFGIVGDGRTDVMPQLRQALLVAGQQRTTLFLPAGIYCCGCLAIPSHVTLRGEANWGYRQHAGTVLRLMDPQAPALIEISNGQGVTLDSLGLDGGKLVGKTHGVWVHNDQQGWPRETENAFRMEHCRVDGFAGDGVHLDKAWAFSLRHNMISHNSGHGVRLAGCDGFFLDNWISGNGGCGFITESWNGSNTFTANRIEWNGQAGMHIRGGFAYQINGNYLDRSGGPGLVLEPWLPHRPFSEHFSITGNMIYRSSKFAKPDSPIGQNCQVYLHSVRGLSFTGNTLITGQDDKATGIFTPYYGLVLGNLDQSVITANNLYRGATHQLIHDLGGHGHDMILRDNPGSLAGGG